MIMQPPAYKPTKGFPRKTFKGVAGTTIALGIAIIAVGVAEIIYSAHIGRKCHRMMEEDMYIDDMVYPADDMPEFRAREKRSHHHRPDHRRGETWMDDVKAESSSSSEDMDHHVRWLADAVSEMDLGERCEMFAGIGALSAVLYAGCAVIFIVTGSLGVAAARTMVGHRQSGLKTGYIVLNILNVLGFAPTVFFIGCFIAKAAPAIVGKDDYYTGHVITGNMIALFGMVLSVLSLVASCISCCCAPTEEHVKVITMAPMPVQQMAPVMVDPAQLRVDEKAQLVDNEATEA